MLNRTAPRSSREAFPPPADLTRIQRFTLDNIVRVPALHIFLVGAGAAIELVILVLYFVGTESDVGPPGNVRSLANYPYPQAINTVMGFFGFYAVALFAISMLLSSDLFSEVRRLSHVVNLGTGVCMIVSWLTYDETTQSGFLSPVFLRCWTLFESTRSVLFANAHVSKPVQAIIVQFVLLSCMILTCVGMCQQSFSLEQNGPVSFEEMLYFVIVTVSTVGYGDVAPSSVLGRVIVIGMIFAAMILLPLLINDIAVVSAYFDSKKGYQATANHVIIVGEFSTERFQNILEELLHPDRKFVSLHLVFVSSQPYSDDVRRLTSAYDVKKRVLLCVGRPDEKEDLVRFKPWRADAVLFYSDPMLPASRGDFRTIQQAVLYRRIDPYLPQHFMLKHTKFSHILEPNAFVIIGRDALCTSIAGLSLRINGASTVLINLIRPTALVPDITAEELNTTSWFRLYQYGAQQSVFEIEVPNEHENRTFSSVALTLQLRAGIAVIGLVRDESTVINPALVKVLLSDRLLVIAPSQEQLARQLSIEHANEPLSGSSQPLALNGPDVFVDDYSLESSRRLHQNCFPFKNHVVLLDTSSARCPPRRCPEEEREARVHRAEALSALAAYFGTFQGFVLVSLETPTEEEARAWRRGKDHRCPIFRIHGTPLDVTSLRMGCLADARAILIFSLSEGDFGNTIRSTHIAAQRLVLDITAPRVVPMLVVLEDADELGLIEPTNTSPVSQRLENVPAFALGCCFSKSMLDAVVFRTYFSEHLPSVLHQLLRVGTLAASRVTSFVSANLVESQKSTYSHLCRVLTSQMMIALAVSRRVTEDENPKMIGHRVMLTNPPLNLLLLSDDYVLFIRPPST